MKTFKRDNWTNEEIIEFLKGQQLDKTSHEQRDWFNFGIEVCIEMFEDFSRPQEESGAMAYCVEDKQIYHIGQILPR